MHPARRFAVWMALPLGTATAIQTAYLWSEHRRLYHNGDAVYYDVQATLLTRGHWFVNPYDFAWKGVVVPSATHPPLTTLVLAAADEVGATSWTGHMVMMAALFVVTVGLCGLVGRELAGDRAGVIVATVVATYPYLWVNPGAVLAETIELALVAAVLWAAVRFWKRPRWTVAAEVGAYLGLAVLTRSELVLLAGLIGVPLVVAARGLTARGRARLGAVAALPFVVLVGPWVGRNMTAFHHTEYLSSEGGVTLATANCRPAYYGPLMGSWSFSCDVATVPPGADESDIDRVERRSGERYVEGHAGRFVEVVGVRVLRTWNLYRPLQQAQLDRSDARPAWVSDAGMVGFYLLAPFAVAGAVVLRRRRALLFPLAALVLTATLAAALFYANGRYRAEGDLAVAVLAGLGIDAARGRRRRRSAAEEAEADPPAGVVAVGVDQDQALPGAEDGLAAGHREGE